MGITKREIASELGVSKRTIANYIGKLGLGNHVSRNGNTDILDDFAAAAIADALKNPEKPSRQPAAAAPAPDSLADSLAAQLEIERSRNAELMEALAAERDRAARAEAEAKAQLAEANARVAELAGKLASLAERQQAIAATPWWRRGRMAMKLLGPGGRIAGAPRPLRWAAGLFGFHRGGRVRTGTRACRRSRPRPRRSTGWRDPRTHPGCRRGRPPRRAAGAAPRG